MEKISLITGINGQDGSYLTELLLDKQYIVYGIIRRASIINTERINHLMDNPNLIIKYGDVTDSNNIKNIIELIIKNYPKLSVLEIYNLAAMSHVQVSFEMPEYTTNVNSIGVLNILETIKSSAIKDKIKFYQASTSELYGLVQEVPQNENTKFYPRSPYAVSKLYSYWLTVNYREAYNMYACNGILFNHESPRRGHNFISRKITRGLNMILNGTKDKLVLGNLYSKRDWGHAKDYV